MSTLRKHLEAYESTPEDWQVDHGNAMMCYDVQDSLAFGLLILDLMNKADESLRLNAFSDQIPREKCEEILREMEGLYHKWLMASLSHLKIIDSLRQQGFSIEGSEQFRSAVDEVQKMMTPDREFFSGSGMIDLRDNAMDAHGRGEADTKKAAYLFQLP